MTDTDTPTITKKLLDVYVRLPDEDRADERELSFRIPDGIPQTDLLAEGWAIDGHSALYGVAAYTEEYTNKRVSMADALLEAQRSVVKLLGDKGYEVRFR